MTIQRDSERYRLACKLLEAANEFWKACHKEGQYGAVQWLSSHDGSLVVFTRGEYRERILQNVETLPGVARENFFAEELEGDE